MLSTDKENITNCPVSVASELATIAIENDAIDIIGRATSWRWREGVISRMPKASTIARILTKSFNSDDPHVWYEKVGENLKPFISKTFGIDTDRRFESGETIKDIFDSLVAVSILTNGATREDLIYKLCFYKFALSMDEEDEIFGLPSHESILSTYSLWAEVKLNKILAKNDYQLNDGLYTFKSKSKSRKSKGDDVQIASEIHTRNVQKLGSLRNKVVGYNSHFDMWRNSYYELTDDQHVEVEKMILKFNKKVIRYIKNNFIADGYKSNDAKKRVYSLSAITLPTKNEQLWCQK